MSTTVASSTSQMTSWNGVEIPMDEQPGRLHAVLPIDAVHAGFNDVLIDVPVGSHLTRLSFAARGRVP